MARSGLLTVGSMLFSTIYVSSYPRYILEFRLWCMTFLGLSIHTPIFLPRLLFSPLFHLWTPTNPLGLSEEMLPLPSPFWPSKLWLGAHPIYPLNSLYFTYHSTNTSVIECLLRCFLSLTWKLSEDGKNTYFATFVVLVPMTDSRYLTGHQSVFWMSKMSE